MSLVGVRPDQLLNHYSQQRGFHIGVLSDDLLTIVLYAAGGLVDSTVMGNASSDGFPHTAFTRDSIKRVLASSGQFEMAGVVCTASRGERAPGCFQLLLILNDGLCEVLAR